MLFQMRFSVLFYVEFDIITNQYVILESIKNTCGKIYLPSNRNLFCCRS